MIIFVFSSRSLSQFGFALLFHDCNVQTGGKATSETHDSASSAGGVRLVLNIFSVSICWDSYDLNFVCSLRLHDGQEYRRR